MVPRPSGIERFLRFGYVAKAFVHGMLAALVIALLLDATGIVGDAGVVQWIDGAPWAQFLLGAAAVGLAAYGVWRGAEAVRDPLERGWPARLGYATSGLVYLALAAETLSLLVAAEAPSGSRGDLTAALTGTAVGRWFLVAAGLAAVVMGLIQIHRAATHRFMLAMQVPELDPRYERTARSLGTTAIASRGVVLSMLGAFVVFGAARLRGVEGGLGPLVQGLALTAWGPWLLAIVAVGLLIYTGYCLFRGAYRSIPATTG